MQYFAKLGGVFFAHEFAMLETCMRCGVKFKSQKTTATANPYGYGHVHVRLRCRRTMGGRDAAELYMCMCKYSIYIYICTEKC